MSQAPSLPGIVLIPEILFPEPPKGNQNLGGIPDGDDRWVRGTSRITVLLHFYTNTVIHRRVSSAPSIDRTSGPLALDRIWTSPPCTLACDILLQPRAESQARSGLGLGLGGGPVVLLQGPTGRDARQGGSACPPPRAARTSDATGRCPRRTSARRASRSGRSPASPVPRRRYRAGRSRSRPSRCSGLRSPPADRARPPPAHPAEA